MTTYTTQQICDKVHGDLKGLSELAIWGIDQLENAQQGQISFVRNTSFAERWLSSRASAALAGLNVHLEPGANRCVIFVPDADLALAVVLEMFAQPRHMPDVGVHQSAVVSSDAQIGQDTAIGAGAFVGPKVTIGQGCTLHPGAIVLAEVQIGDGCELFPGVVIGERCTIGRWVILHSNVVIGTDGFNYRQSTDGHKLVKIPHLGTVEIHDDVEVGAGTCVDRAKFGATVIGEGTKIDNLCQIAHNCVIGRCCVLAAMVGLAGSVVIEDGAQLGGAVGVRDHITIGAGARILARAAIMTDVPPGVSWGGYPAQGSKQFFREVAAVRKLPDLLKDMKRGQ